MRFSNWYQLIVLNSCWYQLIVLINDLVVTYSANNSTWYQLIVLAFKFINYLHILGSNL